jgi:hypothetical protein
MMSREEDIKSLLLSILGTAILRIRSFATLEDRHRIFSEADHIHNLPGLIGNPRPELLCYYFEIERPAFIRQSSNTDAFESDWLRLSELIAEMRAIPSTEAQKQTLK